MTRQVEDPFFCQTMRDVQLVMILLVMVHLIVVHVVIVSATGIQQVFAIFIRKPVSISISQHSGYIPFHATFRRSPPRLVSNFLTYECIGFDGSFAPDPLSLQEERLQIRASSIDVSIRLNVGQARIEEEVVLQTTGSHFDRVLHGVERPVRIVQTCVRLLVQIIRFDIDTSTKGRSTIRRCSHPALDLDIFN